ncbi:extensin family protein [Devosia sp. XJ19-1]|uniref:Extensin family protein n=1 Tax=Devosia ureilytica TaxID=2952754 RepID=A0A9Q4FRL9_9HYPH|nr:extensin family protein [Devosia ureilytica]MCP8883289.1 extensin family protein [Devosia ureilytica]MCP8886343.1 extensin family protein [Devosia ureilytica]
MRILPAAVFALLLATGPVVAQDFLQSFEDFVEEMLPERQAPRAAPRAAPDQPTPVEQRPVVGTDEAEAEPPLPRPRPAPVVREPEPDVLPEPEKTPSAPEEREPERVYQTACPALLGGRVAGEMLEPIAQSVCAERSPLSVTGLWVNGSEIALTSPVITNCQMAGALADWVGAVDLYARAAMNSAVVSVTTGTSFMCRNRLSAADGFVSEHGFANALDIVGFTLANGRVINVESDWLPMSAPEGRLLRQAHGAACGRFTTVLGPEADADHQDHFHLDLGCHGQTCTAQICE